jgi:ADP-glucose pyrophosphorylase
LPLVDFFIKKRKITNGVFELNGQDNHSKYGIVDLDKNSRIIGFEEKPKAPKSNLASAGIYLFPKEEISFLIDYEELMKKNKEKKGIGHLIQESYGKKDIYGFRCKRFIDIGTIDEYNKLK